MLVKLTARRKRETPDCLHKHVIVNLKKEEREKERGREEKQLDIFLKSLLSLNVCNFLSKSRSISLAIGPTIKLAFDPFKFDVTV